MQECSLMSGAAQAGMQSAGLRKGLALAGSPLQDTDIDIMVCIPQRPLKQSGLKHWTSKESTARSGCVQPLGKGRVRECISILRYQM